MMAVSPFQSGQSRGKFTIRGETAQPLADLRKLEVRGTKYGHALLVAAILSGKQEAITILEQLPRSTRYRVQAEVRMYTNLRRGRKLKIV